MNHFKYIKYLNTLYGLPHDHRFTEKAKKAFNGMTKEQALHFLRRCPDKFHMLPNQFQTQEFELISKLS